MAGDGGTFDIGLQALSGAAERNEDIIYVCLDNEAYMNTGIQRSAAPPPSGRGPRPRRWAVEVKGNRSFKKDIARIVADHEVPYVATLSVAHFSDFVRKVQKAKDIKGFRFLHCLTPCVPGWRIEPSKGVSINRLAVDTGMWTLYEVENGVPKVTFKPKEMTAGDRVPQAAGPVQAHDRGGHQDPAVLAVREVEGPLWPGGSEPALRAAGPARKRWRTTATRSMASETEGASSNSRVGGAIGDHALLARDARAHRDA